MVSPQTPGTTGLAIARIDNLKAALDWIAAKLCADDTYASAFQTVVEQLASRRHSRIGPTAAGHPVSHVHFCAIGKSGDVAKLIVSMLTSVGIRAAFLHPTEALHGDLGSVCADDLVVFLSYRGESSELLELIPLLKNRCQSTIAITAFENAPLALNCQKVLYLPVVAEMSAHDHAPITSTVVALALCQLLVAATMDDNRLDLESYASNHPGGAIGKRIFTRVDDLMFKEPILPKVTLADPFTKVISTMTEMAMGAAFVMDHDKLAGIITEKDLREAMKQFGPAIFECLPSTYMNPNPISIAPGTLAVEALRLMERRERPLNFLPVVSQSGAAIGLIRLHDLIKAGIRL
jgi:arabinose-5-phosphate isomerase